MNAAADSAESRFMSALRRANGSVDTTRDASFRIAPGGGRDAAGSEAGAYAQPPRASNRVTRINLMI